jgi:hypothetical protein
MEKPPRVACLDTRHTRGLLASEQVPIKFSIYDRSSANYLRNLRRPIPEGGGYVTKEELHKEQERYLREVRSLSSLLIRSPGDLGGRYWLGYLKRKYPAEYNVLETIKMFGER